MIGLRPWQMVSEMGNRSGGEGRGVLKVDEDQLVVDSNS